MNRTEREQLQDELRVSNEALRDDIVQRQLEVDMETTSAARSMPAIVHKRTERPAVAAYVPNDGAPFSDEQVDILASFVNERSHEIAEQQVASLRNEVIELRAQVSTLMTLFGASNARSIRNARTRVNHKGPAS